LVAPLMNIVAESWLWVLGAYEVCRRAKYRFGSNKNFTMLAGDLKEIRIVLAKGEAANTEKNPIKQVPKFIMNSHYQVGWQYWRKGYQTRRFIRADFAEAWISWGATMRTPQRNDDPPPSP
jgi:hypothetical protein